MMIRCLLRANFSGRGIWLHGEKSQIDFSFKLPKKNAPQKYQKIAPTGNIFKAKRHDPSHIQLKKREDLQYIAKVQQNYQKEYSTKIDQNLKTVRYHSQQYLKGQHLLENIPLDQHYSYKLAEFKRRVEMNKQDFKEFISPVYDIEEISAAKEKMAEAYHQKQQKYEVENFVQYLEAYPGSPKGPNPEDDMENYLHYAYSKMPQVLRDQIAYEESLKQKKHTYSRVALRQIYGKSGVQAEAGYSSLMGGLRSVDPQEQICQDQMITQSTQSPIYKQTEKIPTFPETNFRDYVTWSKNHSNWINFKNYHIQKYGKQVEYLNKVERQNDPNPESEWIEMTPRASSISPYFQTLPKWLQEDRRMKDIYTGLQFYCPDIPVYEKQQALNMAATQCQPLDRVSDKLMSDYIEKKKQYITPFIADKVQTINPEFTWDVKEFFNEIKKEQLKGVSMIKDQHEQFPEPPPKHLDYEDHPSNLPVLFYDNDDGFWDQIISNKLKRYDQVKPIMKERKHYTH